MPDPVLSASLLDASGLQKRYGSTIALADGRVDVRRGEIHGLLGQNGAGKSTIVKILAGVVQRDAGEITIDGQALPHHVHPRLSRELGMSFIHQDLGLIEEMTVAENIALGMGFPNRWGVVDRSELVRQAEEHLERLGVDIDSRALLARLNGADRALVAIARAVVFGAKLVVLDEPTARLRGEEVNRLFGQLDELRRRGVSFIYVTHRLEEVFRLTNRVTVIRDGVTVATGPTSSYTEESLIAEIVGSDLAATVLAGGPEVVGAADAVAGTTALVLRDVAGPEFDSVSFSVRSGEIVGMTGPTGATGSVARTIVGAAQPRGGTIEVFGERGPTSPREALKMQIASIPADRHVDGLALDLTIRENLVLPGYVRREIDSSAGTPGWLHPLRPGRERRLATEIMQRFGIKAQTSEALVSSLSGGNQQKVLLARWLQMAPRLVVLVEPTQGVDVHTRQEIYGLIKEYAAGGVAVLVVSSDLVELCELCDRVMVLRGGRVGAELVGPDITEERIFFESYRTEAVSA